jgi:hypothetical protein
MGSARQSVLPKFLYGAGMIGGSSETGGAPCLQPRLECIESRSSNVVSPLEGAPLPQSSYSDCVILGTKSMLMKPPFSSDSNCVLLDTKTTPSRVPFPELDVNSLVASQLHLTARKCRRSYEGNRHFQDSWVAKLLWSESVLEANGLWPK